MKAWPLRFALTAVCGAGKKAEIDGAYFGGYVKPANRREDRKDRRKLVNQTGKRKVVVIIRERGAVRRLPGVFHTEADALNFIRHQRRPSKPRCTLDEAAGMERAIRPL